VSTKKGGRTGYDEYQYDEQLRAEEDIKREVILELRDGYKTILGNQERMFLNLIATSDLLVESLLALRVYREQGLTQTRREIAAAEESHCVGHCRKHAWDSVDGWKRKVPS
jgi:hypothetical protein